MAKQKDVKEVVKEKEVKKEIEKNANAIGEKKIDEGQFHKEIK